MRLRSYFVHTMEDAMQRAKIELGGDAMLVNTRALEAPEGGRPRMEVVFAIAEAAAPPPPPVVAPETPIAPRLDRFRGELATLLQALEQRPDPAALASVSPAKHHLDQLLGRMIQADVHRPLAESTICEVRSSLETLALSGRQLPSEGFAAFLPAVATETPLPGGRQIRIALIGAPGSGKSSSIAKLAFQFGVARRMSTAVLSLDCVRIGAADQLSKLCRLMGLPFESIPAVADLPAVIRAQSHREAVLIDTPGFVAEDRETEAELCAALGSVDSLQCHAVIQAYLRYGDMARRLDLLVGLRPTHLLFTHLDETSLFGPMWSLARTAALPLSWCATGPRIPEDIEAADAFRLAKMIAGPVSEPQAVPPPRVSAAGASAS